MLERGAFVLGKDGVGGGLDGVEAGLEGGVGELVVGLLQPGGGRLGPAQAGRGPGDDADPVLQGPGTGRDGGRVPAYEGQFGLQRSLLPVQGLAAGGAGGGPGLGAEPVGTARGVLPFGPGELLAGGVQAGGRRVGGGVAGTQVRGQGEEFGGGGVPGGGRGLGTGLPGGGEAELDGGPGLLGLFEGGVGGVLGGPVHMAGGRAGRSGVLRGSAHGAGLSGHQRLGELGGDSAQPGLLELQPALARGGRLLAQVEQFPLGAFGVGGELVPPAGGVQVHPGRFQPARELLGQGGCLLGGVHPLLEGGAGLLPALQPLGGFLVLLLGGP